MSRVTRGYERAIVVETLVDEYGALGVAYCTGHEPKPEHVGIKHMVAKAAAQKAVYDAAHEAQDLAEQLAAVNDRLTDALRERGQFL